MRNYGLSQWELYKIDGWSEIHEVQMPLKHFEKANMQALATQHRCTNGPSKFLSKHIMFCNGFIKTHGTFRCDLQKRFEENAKEMRYCNAKRNVISDVLRDWVGGLSKTISNWQ